MAKRVDPPCRARLMELLDYDPATGVFTRRRGVGGQPRGSHAGAVTSAGYVQIKIDGAGYVAHHLAWLYVKKEWPYELDHRDTNKRNNAIKNLRKASRSQNVANSAARSTNRLGIKGIGIKKGHRSKPFYACFRVGGKHIHVGYFASVSDAKSAYEVSYRKHHGEFARFN